MLISEDQIQELYEINDDPKRKEFLDDLFSFMQKRGTPINRLPIMAKSVLDLYELYNLVIARGGLVDVINKKLWQEIIKGLHLPSSITSAAFTLRTQYMKYLYPYECEKKNLSSPAELQAAIDGNRREGRRSSYGQYEAIHNQMPHIGRQSLTGGMQQMSPLALVTHAANNQQAQAAAVAAAAHHRLMAPSFGQVPNLVTQEIEQRMMIECLKLIQVKKEQNAAMSNGSGNIGLSAHNQLQQPQQEQQLQIQQQQRQRSQSPELNTRDALNAFEMSRVALWQIYHNSSPPASVNTSPHNAGSISNRVDNDVNEVQPSEALNLSDSPTNVNTIKREPSSEISEPNDSYHKPPPNKRAAFPASLYLPTDITEMAAVASNFHYKGAHHDSDAEIDGENDNGDYNITNSTHGDSSEGKHLSDSSSRVPRHHGSSSSVHYDKSDDSAIENSPSTSAASAGNSHISPVSTKKISLSKQAEPHNKTSNANTIVTPYTDNRTIAPSLGNFEALNLLSGMQFHITRNGINSNGEQELVVNLELNGIKYSGVLISNTSNLPIATISSRETTMPITRVMTMDDKIYNNENISNSQSNNNSTANCNQMTAANLSPISNNINSNNSNETSKNFAVSADEIEDKRELAVNDVETASNTSMTKTETSTATPNSVITSGANNALNITIVTP